MHSSQSRSGWKRTRMERPISCSGVLPDLDLWMIFPLALPCLLALLTQRSLARDPLPQSGWRALLFTNSSPVDRWE